MAILASAAIINCILLVVILFICSPLDVEASPVRSRHRRTDDDADRTTRHRTAGGTSVTRPDLESLDYVDSWDDEEENLEGYDDVSEESLNEDYEEQISDSSASSDHHQRRRELNEALTSRVLREQRSKRRSRPRLAIYALQALTNNLQSRAVCGWTYLNNHDMKRIPADLPEAVCDSMTVAGIRNRCEQVYYNVPIRTLEVSTKGVVSWSSKNLAVKVGCTLAAAGTVPYSVS